MAKVTEEMINLIYCIARDLTEMNESIKQLIREIKKLPR